MNEQQRDLLRETIQKNDWFGGDLNIRLDVWSNFHESPDSLRNYLCRDGSGYIRGYYDGAGTLYIKRYHLRDEEWTEPSPVHI
ncbi:MAG: hypothetical protein M1132_11700 [Chloroflexi bacterium]|nr:hypothetical protein [Chloroflexota bacterium]